MFKAVGKVLQIWTIGTLYLDKKLNKLRKTEFKKMTYGLINDYFLSLFLGENKDIMSWILWQLK